MESPVGQGPDAAWQPSSFDYAAMPGRVLDHPASGRRYAASAASEKRIGSTFLLRLTASEKSRGVSCSGACANGVFLACSSRGSSHLTESNG